MDHGAKYSNDPWLRASPSLPTCSANWPHDGMDSANKAGNWQEQVEPSTRRRDIRASDSGTGGTRKRLIQQAWSPRLTPSPLPQDLQLSMFTKASGQLFIVNHWQNSSKRMMPPWFLSIFANSALHSLSLILTPERLTQRLNSERFTRRSSPFTSLKSQKILLK